MVGAMPKILVVLVAVLLLLAMLIRSELCAGRSM